MKRLVILAGVLLVAFSISSVSRLAFSEEAAPQSAMDVELENLKKGKQTLEEEIRQLQTALDQRRVLYQRVMGGIEAIERAKKGEAK